MALNALGFDGVDDRVNCGSGAALDGLTTGTILILNRGGTVLDLSEVLTKTRANDQAHGWRLGCRNNTGFQYWRFIIDRATDTTFSTLTSANAIPTSSSQWYWVAVTFDTAGSPVVKIYGSNFGTSLSEFSYTTTTAGSGAISSDAGDDLIIGGTDVSFWGLPVAVVGIWAGVQSLATIQGYVDDMTTAKASSLIFARLNKNADGTATDDGPNTYALTVTGSPAQITTAPDYMTGGSYNPPVLPYVYNSFKSAV